MFTVNQTLFFALLLLLASTCLASNKVPLRVGGKAVYKDTPQKTKKGSLPANPHQDPKLPTGGSKKQSKASPSENLRPKETLEELITRRGKQLIEALLYVDKNSFEGKVMKAEKVARVANSWSEYFRFGLLPYNFSNAGYHYKAVCLVKEIFALEHDKKDDLWLVRILKGLMICNIIEREKHTQKVNENIKGCQAILMSSRKLQCDPRRKDVVSFAKTVFVGEQGAAQISEAVELLNALKFASATSEWGYFMELIADYIETFVVVGNASEIPPALMRLLARRKGIEHVKEVLVFAKASYDDVDKCCGGPETLKERFDRQSYNMKIALDEIRKYDLGDCLTKSKALSDIMATRDMYLCYGISVYGFSGNDLEDLISFASYICSPIADKRFDNSLVVTLRKVMLLNVLLKETSDNLSRTIISQRIKALISECMLNVDGEFKILVAFSERVRFGEQRTHQVLDIVCLLDDLALEISDGELPSLMEFILDCIETYIVVEKSSKMSVLLMDRLVEGRGSERLKWILDLAGASYDVDGRSKELSLAESFIERRRKVVLALRDGNLFRDLETWVKNSPVFADIVAARDEYFCYGTLPYSFGGEGLTDFRVMLMAVGTLLYSTVQSVKCVEQLVAQGFRKLMYYDLLMKDFPKPRNGSSNLINKFRKTYIDRLHEDPYLQVIGPCARLMRFGGERKTPVLDVIAALEHFVTASKEQGKIFFRDFILDYVRASIVVEKNTLQVLDSLIVHLVEETGLEKAKDVLSFANIPYNFERIAVSGLKPGLGRVAVGIKAFEEAFKSMRDKLPAKRLPTASEEYLMGCFKDSIYAEYLIQSLANHRVYLLIEDVDDSIAELLAYAFIMECYFGREILRISTLQSDYESHMRLLDGRGVSGIKELRVEFNAKFVSIVEQEIGDPEPFYAEPLEVGHEKVDLGSLPEWLQGVLKDAKYLYALTTWATSTGHYSPKDEDEHLRFGYEEKDVEGYIGIQDNDMNSIDGEDDPHVRIFVGRFKRSKQGADPSEEEEEDDPEAREKAFKEYVMSL